MGNENTKDEGVQSLSALGVAPAHQMQVGKKTAEKIKAEQKFLQEELQNGKVELSIDAKEKIDTENLLEDIKAQSVDKKILTEKGLHEDFSADDLLNNENSLRIKKRTINTDSFNQSHNITNLENQNALKSEYLDNNSLINTQNLLGNKIEVEGLIKDTSNSVDILNEINPKHKNVFSIDNKKLDLLGKKPLDIKKISMDTSNIRMSGKAFSVDKPLKTSLLSNTGTGLVTSSKEVFSPSTWNQLTGGNFKGGINTALSNISSKAFSVLKTATMTAKKEMIKGAATLLAPILALMLLLFAVVSAVIGAGVVAPTAFFELNTYPATEENVTDSTLSATNHIEEKKEEVNKIEENPAWDSIDEFVYIPSKDSILSELDYDGWQLQAYLNAVFENYNASDVEAEIQSIIDEVFQLSYSPSVEMKTDEDGELYEYWTLTITLNKKDFETVLISRMDEKQKAMYDVYMNDELLGGSQGVFNPFSVDWRSHISCKYGYRENPTHPEQGSEFHTGLDLAFPQGTPIMAGVNGTVTKVTTAYPYGNRVEITTKEGNIRVLYAHMNTITVSNGQMVIAGQTQIGTVGTTGNSSGNHLHIEIFLNGNRIDPLFYLSYSPREN